MKTLINSWKTLARSLVLKYCHIAVAHKLPDAKNVKNRHIVKFIQRGKVELYKNRKNLVGKNISHLPSIDDRNGKIFINESLTSYRKRLFGRIREYKRKNNAKYICGQATQYYAESKWYVPHTSLYDTRRIWGLSRPDKQLLNDLILFVFLIC